MLFNTAQQWGLRAQPVSQDDQSGLGGGKGRRSPPPTPPASCESGVFATAKLKVSSHQGRESGGVKAARGPRPGEDPVRPTFGAGESPAPELRNEEAGVGNYRQP